MAGEKENKVCAAGGNPAPVKVGITIYDVRNIIERMLEEEKKVAFVRVQMLDGEFGYVERIE